MWLSVLPGSAPAYLPLISACCTSKAAETPFFDVLRGFYFYTTTAVSENEVSLIITLLSLLTASGQGIWLQHQIRLPGSGSWTTSEQPPRRTTSMTLKVRHQLALAFSSGWRGR